MARSDLTQRWTWRRVCRRAVEVVREEGIRSLWFRILSETVYRRVVLMELPLDQPVAEVTARLPVVVELLGASDADDYASFRSDTDLSETRRRLGAGQWCFVARHQGRIVHAGWAVPGRAWIDYLACDINLAPAEVYQYESFTAPGFRGLSLAAMRVTAMARYLRQAGYRRLVAVVVPENVAAFRPLEKAGYRPFGMMGYVRLGPWRRDFLRTNRSSHALSYRGVGDTR